MAHITRDRTKLRNRVRRIRGQIEAVEKALDGDEDCSAVLQTIAATRGALNGLMAQILEGHIREHVIDPGRKPTQGSLEMANTKSAKKAVRQTIRRTDINKTRRTEMRGSVRKVEEAIASGNKEAAQAALKEAEPVMARTAQQGIQHRRTASRKVSRLSKRISAMATA